MTGASFLDVDFTYVTDPRLREIVTEFHKEAVSAYQAKNYVAAVVLAGGVLEGILTFALLRRGEEAVEEYKRLRNRSQELANWSLNDLVEVAARLNLVGESPAKAANAVRDFRNFVHPYRLLRRSRPRWDALATMALSAVAVVSESLQGRIDP